MAGSICSSARDYVDHVGSTLAKMDCDAVDALTELVFQAWQEDRQVFVFGNGGSAATASHYVTDLVKTCAVGGVRRLRAFCLADNVPLTTALGNDIDYNETFRYPLESYARAGDLAIAISGSGTSPNVVAACEWAKANGVTLASLTGFSGGTIGDMADVHVNVPSDNYGAIEDVHLSIGHMIIQSLHGKLKIESTEALAS